MMTASKTNYSYVLIHVFIDFKKQLTSTYQISNVELGVKPTKKNDFHSIKSYLLLTKEYNRGTNNCNTM